MTINFDLSSLSSMWSKTIQNPQSYSAQIKQISWLALGILALSMAVMIGWKLGQRKIYKQQQQADSVVKVFKKNLTEAKSTSVATKNPIDLINEQTLSSIFSRVGMPNQNLALVSKRWNHTYQTNAYRPLKQDIKLGEDLLDTIIYEAIQLYPILDENQKIYHQSLQYDYVSQTILKEAQSWEGHTQLFVRLFGIDAGHKLESLTSFTPTSHPLGIYKLQYMAKWIKDQNLLLFFETCATQNYAFNKAVKNWLSTKKDLGVNQRAKAIREWMVANPEPCQLIRRLRINETKLSELPPEIGYLTELTSLNLSHNNLRYLPSTIGQLEKLEILCVGHNKLYSLPTNMGSLNQLKKLYLQKNNLFILPEAIKKLIKLVELNLDDNQLKELPDCFENLLDLEIIHLKFNQIMNLPLSIQYLEKLHTLYLYSNNLHSLPDLRALKNLKLLFINSNPNLKWENNLLNVSVF